jgi:hypothetical protein
MMKKNTRLRSDANGKQQKINLQAPLELCIEVLL